MLKSKKSKIIAALIVIGLGVAYYYFFIMKGKKISFTDTSTLPEVQTGATEEIPVPPLTVVG